MRRWHMWVLAAAFGVAYVALYVGAVLTPLGQSIDAGSLSVLGPLRGEAWLAVYDGRDLILAALLGTAAVAALSVAFERNWKAPLMSAILIGVVAAVATSGKAFLPRPYHGDFAYAVNTYPSGHAALCLAAAVAIIWCAPRWFSRIVVVVLGALVLFVALASVLSFAHRVSDSLGGILLTGAVSCVLVAIGRPEPRAISRARSITMLVIGLVLAASMLSLAAVLGLFGEGDQRVQLEIAIVLSLLGSVAAVLVVQPSLRVPVHVGADAHRAVTSDGSR